MHCLRCGYPGVPPALGKLTLTRSVPRHLLPFFGMKRPINYAKMTKEELVKRLKSLEGSATAKGKDRKERPFNFSEYPTKHVALRVAYFGWNYNGFASQMSYKPLSHPEAEDGADGDGGVDRSVQQRDSNVTAVEDVLFAALAKTRLIESPRTCNYSRCGRTDTGVSSTAQVVALTVRSSAKKRTLCRDAPSEDFDIPICRMLNGTLPPDIRVLGWSYAPVSFNARFDCIGREYKYYFCARGLDLAAMREAAHKLMGRHDFRNFCRRDPSRTITNYVREIFAAEIVEVGEEPGMCYFGIHGSAFLYHQVRCIMEILFRVGGGLESSAVVDYMLDVERCAERPVYGLASEIPLVLTGCHYPARLGLQWNLEETEKGKLYGDLFTLWRDLKVKAMSVALLCEELDTPSSCAFDRSATKTILPKE